MTKLYVHLKMMTNFFFVAMEIRITKWLPVALPEGEMKELF